jgi:two-component system, chemotaxis family, sensor kinase CheA
MNEENKEFIKEYLSEAEDLLQTLGDSLLELEDKQSAEAINKIFRAAHTLKSSSLAMGFERVGELSHKMEDVFAAIRDKHIKLTTEQMTITLKCYDALNLMFKNISKGEAEGVNISPFINALDGIIKSKSSKKTEKLEKVKSDTVSLAERPENFRADLSVKVPMEKLDKLMELTGELLIQKMQLNLIRESKEKDDAALDRVIKQIDRLTEDLQYEIMNVRLMPISFALSQFKRLVRDLSHKEGKKINYVVEGGDTELDKTILDEIGEPLIHMLRNAIDHGIESPEERKKAGKSEEGMIKIVAQRDRDSVLISVEDDGQGFDTELIKKIALEKHIVSSTQLNQMSEEKILTLTFNPAFSTSAKVSSVSGRGVGLDVVGTKLTALGGSTRIESEKGKGTRMIMRLPLTLAIVKTMIVKVGTERYGIPVHNILRSVRVPKNNIKTIEGHETFILDNENIPIVRLSQLFNLGGNSNE